MQSVLREIRRVVTEAVPGAEEKISYRMPAFALNGILVYFAAFKKHIGLFPPVRGDRKLVAEAAAYAGPKGNLQFPLNRPIPYALIRKIVKHRAKENSKKTRASAKRKKSSARKRRA